MTFYILQKDLFPFQCLQYIQETAVSLHRKRNLTSVSNHGNVWEAAPISLSWAPNGLNELPEMRFGISFHPDWQIDNGIFNRPIMTRTKILVHRLGPRTRISALFGRRS